MKSIITLLLPVLLLANTGSPDRIPEYIDPYADEFMNPYGPEVLAEMSRGEVVGFQRDYSIQREGGPWTEIGGIPGATVEELVFAPSSPNVVYASTYGDGVYKSTDSGNTWSETGLTDLLCSWNGLDVDPQNPDVVYVGAYNAGYFEYGTFRSQDGGNSWEIWGPDSLTYAYTIEVNPVHPDTVYLGGPEGFFYTWNGGDTWFQNYDAGSYISHIRSHPSNSDGLCSEIRFILCEYRCWGDIQ